MPRDEDIDHVLADARSQPEAFPGLNKLAAEAHFSPSYLSRVLRQRVGYPLHVFLPTLEHSC